MNFHYSHCANSATVVAQLTPKRFFFLTVKTESTKSMRQILRAVAQNINISWISICICHQLLSKPLFDLEIQERARFMWEEERRKHSEMSQVSRLQKAGLFIAVQKARENDVSLLIQTNGIIMEHRTFCAVKQMPEKSFLKSHWKCLRQLNVTQQRLMKCSSQQETDCHSLLSVCKQCFWIKWTEYN